MKRSDRRRDKPNQPFVAPMAASTTRAEWGFTERFVSGAAPANNWCNKPICGCTVCSVFPSIAASRPCQKYRRPRNVYRLRLLTA